MIRGIQIFIFFTLSVTCFSQVVFEKGYFIDENGKRTVCLIKNVGSFDNPEKFDYKLEEGGEVLKRDISNTIEYGIGEEVKYERYLVEIDLSSDEVEELTDDRNPTFEEKLVFLRKIIEGEFNLYDYVDGNLRRFFVSNSEIPPTQLVYRRYMSEKLSIGFNNKFKGQLNYLFNCQKNIPTEKLSYTNASIIGYVKKVYECKGEPFIQYKKSSNFQFNMKLKGGYRLSNLDIETTRVFGVISVNEEFEQSGGAVFGMELEYVLPFLKNRLSVPVNFLYQYASFEKEGTELFPQDHTYVLDYSSLEMMVALRYNYFFSTKTKLGFSAGMAFDLFNDDTNQVEYSNSIGTIDNPLYEIKTTSNFVLGINIEHDRYFAELGYGLTRKLSNFSASHNVKYSYLHFIVGYRIFSTSKK